MARFQGSSSELGNHRPDHEPIGQVGGAAHDGQRQLCVSEFGQDPLIGSSPDKSQRDKNSVKKADEQSGAEGGGKHGQ